MNNFSTWLTAVMLVIFSTMVGMATQFPEDARFMPFIVGIPGVALCLVQLALDAKRALGVRSLLFQTAPKAGKPVEAIEMDLPEFGPHTARSELVMWGYFVGFIAGLLAFGFYVAIPVMLIAFLRREARAGWRMTLGLGIGGTVALYLMFGALLHIQLYAGMVSPLILHRFGS